jgi:hypothetical protein
MNVNVLKKYVDRQNKWNSIFARGQHRDLDLYNREDRVRIADMIDAALSPENLTCDGELCASDVARRYKELTLALKQLQALQ